jgi:LacI family transcriptional regulator
VEKLMQRQTEIHTTIADVAHHSGFSPMTVSRVINGGKHVRKSTREAVLASVSTLNYSPNLAARSLAGVAQMRIGLLFSNPSAAYLSRLLVGCLEQAGLHHIQLIIEKCDEAHDMRGTLRNLVDSGVEGILLSPPLCDNEEFLAMLERENIVTVIVANWTPPGNVSTIRIDDVAAAKAMTRHLIELGHKRIAFIEGHPEHKASEQRLQGFQAAMKEAGLNIDVSLIVEGHFNYRSGLAAAQQLLERDDRPTAIFAANDDMAAATVTVAHRLHLDVPGQLTVCGFDDTDFAQSIWPELTTIHQPISDMARAAIKMLFAKVHAKRNGNPDVRHYELHDFTMVRRDSDAPPQL